MKDMSLSQLMRFGLAGGIYLGALIVGFVEPRAFVSAQISALALGLAVALCLVAGSIIYPLHRALAFPVIRKGLFLLTGEKRAAIDFDLERWSLAIDLCPKGSLQSNLAIWADQIHFLYCASWASFLALVTGRLLGWSRSSHSLVVLGFALLMLLVGLLYNYRYHRYEQRAVQSDRDRAAQLTKASSR